MGGLLSLLRLEARRDEERLLGDPVGEVVGSFLRLLGDDGKVVVRCGDTSIVGVVVLGGEETVAPKVMEDLEGTVGAGLRLRGCFFRGMDGICCQ